MVRLLLLLFSLNCSVGPAFCAEYVFAQTATGRVRGRVEQLSSGAIAVFTGIPYAQPPNGTLRFEKTRPLAEEPNRQLDALEMPPVCVPHHRKDNLTQDWDQYSEDCLYLNIFAPHDGGQRGGQMPVLVLIYVGGFEFASMRRYKDYSDIGPKFVSKGIVVVAMQFRIGFFGFSSTGDSQMPGNYGYWDMAEALRWINRNVRAFGGDAAQTTLFGYSSSATAIATLTLSPHSRDLFQKCITMSGPIMSSRGANTERVVSTTGRLASQLGCATGNSQKECMKGKSIDQMLDAMDRIGSTVEDTNYDLFGPLVDGDFVPKEFGEMLKEAKPKPTIMGLTELDPLGFTLLQSNTNFRNLAIPSAEWPTFGRAELRSYLLRKALKRGYFGTRTDGIASDVVDFYTSGYEEDNWFYLSRAVHFLADVQFYVPFLWEVRQKIDRGWLVWLYLSRYVNRRRFPAGFPLQKAFHDTDHSFVIRHPYSGYEYDADDLAMERQWTAFVTNFIFRGVPHPDWPRATDRNAIVRVDVHMDHVNETVFDLCGMHFWEEMVRKYPEYNLILGTRQQDPNSASPPTVPRQTRIWQIAVLLIFILCQL